MASEGAVGSSTVLSAKSSVSELSVTSSNLGISVSVEPTAPEISVGESIQLEASVVKPDGSQFPGNAKLDWLSQDPLVAEVSSAGRVRGVAPGVATIRVVAERGSQIATGSAVVTVVEGTEPQGTSGPQPVPTTQAPAASDTTTTQAPAASDTTTTQAPAASDTTTTQAPPPDDTTTTQAPPPDDTTTTQAPPPDDTTTTQAPPPETFAEATLVHAATPDLTNARSLEGAAVDPAEYLGVVEAGSTTTAVDWYLDGQFLGADRDVPFTLPELPIAAGDHVLEAWVLRTDNHQVLQASFSLLGDVSPSGGSSPGSDSGSSTTDSGGGSTDSGSSTTTSGGSTTSSGGTSTSGGSSPVPVSSGVWEHEPSGMTVIDDNPMDHYPPFDATNAPNGSSKLQIVNTSTPTDDDVAYREEFWVGMEGGVGPSIQQRNFGRDFDNVFIGFYWMVSENFENHPSNINKMIFSGRQGTAVSLHYFAADHFDFQPVPLNGIPGWWAGRIRPLSGTPKIVGGRWYKVEMLLERQSGDYWRARLWVDGSLYIDSDVTGVDADNGRNEPLRLVNAGYNYAEIASIWGGMGSTKTKTDYMWWDHVYMSGK